MAATHLKKVGRRDEKTGKLSGDKKKHLEEHRDVNWEQGSNSITGRQFLKDGQGFTNLQKTVNKGCSM